MKSARTIGRARTLLISGPLILGTLYASPSLALAASIVVGDGTASSCTEWALQNALVAAAVDGADTIKFNCSPSPVTIAVTATTYLPDGLLVALVPPDDTTIDGEGRITLRLSDPLGSLIAVGSDSTVTVQNLTLQGIGAPGALPNDVSLQPNILNRGALLLRNMLVTGLGDNTTIAPPAIDNYGTLDIQNSTVSGITGTWRSSAPIRNFGIAAINHSSFLGNSHYPYEFVFDNGGAVFNAGQLAVYNSVFADNAAFSSGGSGGAIDNLGGTVFVHGSQFFRNRAYRGGAISNRRGGTITVMNTTFGHNVGFEGGALLGSYAEAAFSTVVVHHCTFFRNGASWGGAIELMNGKLLVENSRITENSALHGGGISLGKAELRIVNSDVSFNGASFSGGGIYSPIGDVITLVNSDVTSNSALSGGGVYLSSTSSLTLIRSDVVDNMLDNVYQVPAFTISPTGLSGPTLLER